jgi:hypothetical protein
MDAFLQFLDSDDRVKLCPIFALRTQPNKGLKPVSDYVTVFHNAATQTSSRTYKYAEGLANLQLTAKGTTLRSDHMIVLEVQRSCQCSAVEWTERVSVKDIRDRKVQVRFTSVHGEHAYSCVADDAEKRCKPLIAKHVAVKSLSRAEQVKAMDIESGLVAVDLKSVVLSAELMLQAKDVPYRMARNTIKNTRKVGREGKLQDFEVIKTMIQRDLLRHLGTDESSTGVEDAVLTKIRRQLAAGEELDVEHTVALLENDGLQVIEFHPVDDPSCKNVDDRASWFWVLLKLPYDQSCMAEHGGVCLAYDAKVKFIIDGLHM